MQSTELPYLPHRERFYLPEAEKMKVCAQCYADAVEIAIQSGIYFQYEKVNHGTYLECDFVMHKKLNKLESNFDSEVEVAQEKERETAYEMKREEL